MGVQYVNRRGDTYYLLVGTTKTGKPKYYVSKKPGDNVVDSVPGGFELYEHPADGLVHVRKIRTTRVLPLERELVADAIRRLTGQRYFFVETDGDSLVIYWPNVDADRASQTIGRLMGVEPLGNMQKWFVQHGRFSPEMRFTLHDVDQRHFIAQRMCYRSDNERWLLLSPPTPLRELVEEFVPHLGQESFFELS